MGKTIFDLNCENFDHYFASQLSNLTPEAKDGLPSDIVFKLFRKGGVVNSKSTSKLSFLAKLYVLCRSLGKRWYLVIEDEEKGLKFNQFNDVDRILKERDLNMTSAEDLILTGGYILADRELSDTYSVLNRLSASKPYNYLVRAKNAPKSDISEENKAVNYIIQFLTHYEGNKRDLVAKSGFSMPELLVLLALYPGEEVEGSSLYKETYKRAFQSNPGKLRKAFVSLQAKGYIRKYGVTYGSKLQITSLGKDVLRGIMDKYWLNF